MKSKRLPMPIIIFICTNYQFKYSFVIYLQNFECDSMRTSTFFHNTTRPISSSHKIVCTYYNRRSRFINFDKGELYKWLLKYLNVLPRSLSQWYLMLFFNNSITKFEGKVNEQFVYLWILDNFLYRFPFSLLHAFCINFNPEIKLNCFV